MRIQNEPLMKLQTKEYMEFIRNFTESVNIMTKSFFIVVPYSENTFIPSNNNVLDNLFKKKSNEEKKLAEKMDFEEKRSQLEQRVSVIQQGLNRCGIKSAQLGTEEAIEVFYKVFNPGELEGKIQLDSQI
jgi:hypothetical protein